MLKGKLYGCVSDGMSYIGNGDLLVVKNDNGEVFSELVPAWQNPDMAVGNTPIPERSEMLIYSDCLNAVDYGSFTGSSSFYVDADTQKAVASDGHVLLSDNVAAVFKSGYIRSDMLDIVREMKLSGVFYNMDERCVFIDKQNGVRIYGDILQPVEFKEDWDNILRKSKFERILCDRDIRYINSALELGKDHKDSEIVFEGLDIWVKVNGGSMGAVRVDDSLFGHVRKTVATEVLATAFSVIKDCWRYSYDVEPDSPIVFRYAQSEVLVMPIVKKGDSE